MMTASEMRAQLYERARAYVADMQPDYGQEAITRYAHDGVDAMINARITAGADETAALEHALGQDIRKLITVVMAQ